jgi:hypothetical protein
MTVFPPHLIAKCKLVFEKKAGHIITDEQAQIILDRLARLGMVIGKIEMERKKKQCLRE